MALKIFGSDSIGTGIRADLGAGDSVFVATGATVGRTDGDLSAPTITGSGSLHMADIHGNVVGLGLTVNLGDEVTDSDNSLFLAEGGVIRSFHSVAARVLGYSSNVENRGQIIGTNYGLIIGGDNANTQTVVDNAGEIISNFVAINRYGGGRETLVINNSGLIQGGNLAFTGYGEDATDIINNSGRIVGKIDLSSGDDRYDGRTGIVEGVVQGGGGADTLLGGAGNEIFNGDTGADHMEAGKGDDSYAVDNVGDVVIEKAGEGTDKVTSAISYVLTGNVENLDLLGTGVENLDGTGNALANVITGNNGKNILKGLAGNDTLDGGGNIDRMEGGTGNDLYVVDDSGDVVIERAGEGTDVVQSSATYTLAADIERLALTGSTDIDGTGNALANLLTGNDGKNTLKGMAGNDTLDGGAGADVLEGGAGNDTYIVDDGGDAITELSGEGTDTVKAWVSQTLSANVEKLILLGTDDIGGTGTADANTLTGNAGSNLLRGLKGNDTLDGKGGVDQMEGGIGNDIYVVDNSGDTIVELSGEGTDTVKASKSYALSANVETLILTGTGNINGTGSADANMLTGNAGKNVLKGMDGNDLLNGGAGADRMEGGKGNDTFVVDNAGDVVVEASGAGTGTDTVKASLTFALADNVENLALTGTGDIGGTGNSAANILTGNSGKNTLIGLAGNDTLNGGAGTDHMEGGTGNDTYVVDNAGDKIVELSGEGTDTVKASKSHTLAANVEKLVLTGTGNLNGTGNELANTLTGNAGANILKGMAGNDVLD
ncbi:MAG: calcium-binding protein, partial [Shinella sp.]|nr:calcium-binding protein [Shinella sp.]